MVQCTRYKPSPFYLHIGRNYKERITNKKSIGNHILAKYMDLFRELDIDCPPDLEGLITPCVSDAENFKLSKIPALQKIMEMGHAWQQN